MHNLVQIKEESAYCLSLQFETTALADLYQLAAELIRALTTKELVRIEGDKIIVIASGSDSVEDLRGKAITVIFAAGHLWTEIA